MKKFNSTCLMIVTLLVVGLFANMFSVALAKENNVTNGMDLVRAIALDQDIVDSSIEQSKDIKQPEELIVDISQATAKMDEARQQLLGEDTAQKDDAGIVKIIMEQNAAIVVAKYKLEKLYAQLEKDAYKDDEESYWSGLVDYTQDILKKIKRLYTYSADEKEIARQTVEGLKEQKSIIMREFVPKLAGLSFDKRDQLKKRYKAIIEQFNDVIYQQQLISGDVTSTQKKLLKGAAVAAGTAAGLALANTYLATTPEKKQPLVMKASTTITEHPTGPSEEEIETLKQMGFAQERPGSIGAGQTVAGSTVVRSEDLEHLRQIRFEQEQAKAEEEAALTAAIEKQEALAAEEINKAADARIKAKKLVGPQEQQDVTGPTEAGLVVNEFNDEELKRIVEKELDAARKERATYINENPPYTDAAFNRLRRIEAIEKASSEGNVSPEDREYLEQIERVQERVDKAQDSYDKSPSWWWNQLPGGNTTETDAAYAELEAAKAARDALWNPSLKGEQQQKEKAAREAREKAVKAAQEKVAREAQEKIDQESKSQQQKDEEAARIVTIQVQKEPDVMMELDPKIAAIKRELAELNAEDENLKRPLYFPTWSSYIYREDDPSYPGELQRVLRRKDDIAKRRVELEKELNERRKSLSNLGLDGVLR